ncbi:MAG: outer membrane lipoprotein chaperone LolA [Gammaproteobacteria bacterium]|nr:outer membrane lipoprotein chaperone LolA [Gammaproteobacteria bacterium]
MRKLFLILLLCLSVSIVDAESGRERLEQFVVATDSWQADFEQRVFSIDGALLDESSGRFTLLRPGYFRWEYHSPWLQTIVADGQRIWLYDEDLEQVTVRDITGGLSQTPAALLSGNISSLGNLNVVSITAADGVTRLELAGAANDSDFDSVALLFREQQLIGLMLGDKLGQTTRINFSNSVSNPGFSPADFDLVIPDTVDVIDESNF